MTTTLLRKSDRILVKAAKLIIEKEQSYEQAIKNLKPGKSASSFLRANLPNYLKAVNSISYILEKAKCSTTDPDLKLAAYFSIKKNHCVEDKLLSGFNEWLTLISSPPSLDSLSLKYGFHPDLMAHLQTDHGMDKLPALLESLSKPGPITFRLPLLFNHEKFLAEVKNMQSISNKGKFHVSLNPGSYYSFNRRKHPGVEVQDLGSQAISQLADPQKGMKILDLCAGRGGKTLHLADMTGDQSFIYATDFEESRVAQLKRRNSELYKSIRCISYSDVAGYSPYDMIIIDAPCSGSGSLRRNPGLALRPIKRWLAELRTIQIDLLEKAKNLVKQDGVIIYATCSILSLENEQPIETFIKTNKDWEIKNVQPYLSKNSPAHLLPQGSFLKLNPLAHNTDGFFAARLQRKNSNGD